MTTDDEATNQFKHKKVPFYKTGRQLIYRSTKEKENNKNELKLSSTAFTLNDVLPRR